MSAELADGLLIRIGSREDAERRSVRLLATGRVMIRRLDDRGLLAHVRGDSGQVRTVIYGFCRWTCDCPARSRCAHVRAVQKVVAVPQGPSR